MLPPFKVSALMAYNYWVRRPKKLPNLTNAEFHLIITQQMINNPALGRGVSSEGSGPPSSCRCKLVSYKKGEGEWKEKKACFMRPANEYQKYSCKHSAGCKAMVRTYCTCDPKTTICKNCYALHLADIMGQEKATEIAL